MEEMVGRATPLTRWAETRRKEQKEKERTRRGRVARRLYCMRCERARRGRWRRTGTNSLQKRESPNDQHECEARPCYGPQHTDTCTCVRECALLHTLLSRGGEFFPPTSKKESGRPSSSCLRVSLLVPSLASPEFSHFTTSNRTRAFGSVPVIVPSHRKRPMVREPTRFISVWAPIFRAEELESVTLHST